MCRLIGAVGRYSIVRHYYGELIKGLIGASEYDPYSLRAFGPEDVSHKDGWGRFSLLLGMGINRIASSIYKSLSPIFVDKPQEVLPKTDLVNFSDPLILDFVLARAASTGMPINYLSVQPFEAQTRDGSRIIVIHNGSVHKDKLATEIGIKIPEEVVKKYSDSYILALKLAELINGELDPEILKQFKDYVKTALNLGIVLISENHVIKVFGSYYRKDLPREYWDYYKMYLASVERENFFYASSTIVDFMEYRPRNVEKWQEIENGAYFFIRIDLSRTKDIEISVEKYYI
ncbi:hypothetical protein [Thermofilum sp.]|uniref:class II glutamine amidotransferase n=1 Tax=Thermofilum sp. TaxID=1961369 RepID=UPI00316302AC